MSDIDLKQEFENNFDCYTQLEHGDGGDTEEMAISKDKFVEVVSKLLKANGVDISENTLPIDSVVGQGEQLKCNHDWKTVLGQDYQECRKCGEGYAF